jgi:lysozyme
MISGVDVSSYQGLPSQWQAAAGDYDFAAVKFTELQPGGVRYVSPTAAADWAYLKSAGKLRIAYLFGHPSTSPNESAALFLGAVGRLDDGDIIALDSEDSDGLPPDQVAAWGLTVLEALRADAGRKPLEYCDLSWAEAGNCAGHEDAAHLWIADPSSPPGRPQVPAPWTGWKIQQVSIDGAIDRDVADYATAGDMARDLGKRDDKVRVRDYETDGKLSLAQVARKFDTAASTVLRRTVIRDGLFSHDLAEYINGADLTLPMPPGIKLRVPDR